MVVAPEELKPEVLKPEDIDPVVLAATFAWRSRSPTPTASGLLASRMVSVPLMTPAWCSSSRCWSRDCIPLWRLSMKKFRSVIRFSKIGLVAFTPRAEDLDGGPEFAVTRLRELQGDHPSSAAATRESAVSFSTCETSEINCVIAWTVERPVTAARILRPDSIAAKTIRAPWGCSTRRP